MGRARVVAVASTALALASGLAAVLLTTRAPPQLLSVSTANTSDVREGDAQRDLAASFLFRGLDSGSGEKASAQAVEGQIRGGPARGDTLTFSAYSDVHSFAAQLGMELDGDLRSRTLKTNSDLEALAAFVNSMRLEPSTVLVLALAQQTHRYTAGSVRFASDVDIGADREKDFAARYGDAFIAEAVTGAAYVGALVCRNATKGRERFLAAKLEVAVAEPMRTDPAAAAAGLERVEAEFRCNCAIKEGAFGAVGGASQPSRSATDVAVRAHKWAQGRITTPALVHVTSTSYGDVEAIPLPRALERIIDNRAYAAATPQLLRELADRRRQVVKIYQAYDVYDYPAGDGSLDRIWSALASIDKATAGVREWLTAFSQNVATATPRPDTSAVVQVPMPEPCVTVGYSQEAGVAAATKSFDDGAFLAASRGGESMGDAVLRQARLAAIEVRTDDDGVVSLKRLWRDTGEDSGFASDAEGGRVGHKAKLDVGKHGVSAARYGLAADGSLVSVELTLGGAERTTMGNAVVVDRLEWFAPPPEGHPVPMGFAGFYDDDYRHGRIARLQMVYAVFHPFYWDTKRCERDS